ncbi:MAG: hypothetical protein IPO91_11745 [Chloroflexi bacterium]|uniref:hypothetical protein n=1 Tax=Candidatus Flexifilum breve TaxID=3140694 RepID=UPI00313609A7|nr:hypothetical protein [Chloroflexota bacterium]MBK9747440.1 hypothetical protein [Chloroflexota bacterium]
MLNPARSILIFGFYVIGLGLSLFFTPNVAAALLGFPATVEIWANALGALAIALGLYYVKAARDHNVELFRTSVWVRTLFFALFGIAILTHPGYNALLVIAAGDLLGAVWTWLALRQSAPKPGTIL